KFFLIMAGAGQGNYLLIIIAAINMIVSLYYYLKVVKAIFMDANEHPIEKLRIPPSPRLAFFICIAGILLTGLMSYVYEYIFSLSTGF
ncbi:MAG TPA: NADH-quinone oxidoreductase subunit N, partial [Chitinophagaceae bacterium]|nr:NADH-quinone oxidoreductase subunit N [Chitinophagaceae bacterium]